MDLNQFMKKRQFCLLIKLLIHLLSFFLIHELLT
jgi:hypothetical protein